MTDWLDTLRAEVAKASLRRVAEKLRGGNGYPSETLLSQVLNGKYKGQTERLQRLVEGYFHGASVACPVLGEITRDRCDHQQRLPFAATNPTRVALYRACRGGCPHSTLHSTLEESL
mgnify:CR=1 FL=1|jgi:hypothetical protein